jgi:hypothetical protein
MGNKFVNKSQAHKQFSFDDQGMLRVIGVIAQMTPMVSEIAKFTFLTEQVEKKKVEDCYYYTGFAQGVVAVKLLKNKFGIQNKKSILDHIIEQSGMGGFGKLTPIRFNEEKKQFIMQFNSTFAKLYKNILGLSNECIDHFARGNLAGVFTELYGEQFIGFEKQCIAQGKKFCILEYIPEHQIDKIEEKVKKQIPTKLNAVKSLKKFSLTSNFLH